ncbi:DUF126 domain-containing protein [Methanocaldococcus indicus]|uniref:DUF126 domain-containing protein n=1 Tax=Methanocaldococcus indicus TaxID=213231 RepID=UPI003C6D05B6
MILKGRSISKGICEGIALVSKKPFSFLGGVDDNGNIIDKSSDVYGENLKDKIFVFPYGKGSTVGSYVIYSLAKKGILKGIINLECEPIIATGAILGGIPAVDKIDIDKIKTGDKLLLDGSKGIVKIL